MKKTVLLLIIILVIASCTDDHTLKKPQQSTTDPVSLEKRDELKTSFGKALANALAESPSLRNLLKEEALKMFNNDYDVLYHLIKAKKLANELTVRQNLLKYFDSEEQLLEIENDLPLLTIFIPELPEKTFSASIWNTDIQIPVVGITSYKTNDVNIVDSKGKEFILESDKIPAFPVVVIKENERVVPVRGNERSFANGRTIQDNDDMRFKFLSDCFDGSVKTNTTQRILSVTDQKIIDAYNIYNGTDGWQRDYIYYNITPSQTRGPFSYNYAEHITSFRLLGDPKSAYSKISDQTGDPTFDPLTKKANTHWSGGYFEFKVRVLLNAKNGIGEELITYFGALPDEIFSVFYHKFGPFYIASIIGLKSKSLNLPLFPWDLNNYASTFKVEIEEVDVTETIVTNESRAVKFATNFSVEGTLMKIGMKFGASLEETRTSSIQKTYTLANDLLGPVIVNFADNVLISPDITREYPSGWYTLTIEPTRVQ